MGETGKPGDGIANNLEKIPGGLGKFQEGFLTVRISSPPPPCSLKVCLCVSLDGEISEACSTLRKKERKKGKHSAGAVSHWANLSRVMTENVHVCEIKKTKMSYGVGFKGCSLKKPEVSYRGRLQRPRAALRPLKRASRPASSASAVEMRSK